MAEEKAKFEMNWDDLLSSRRQRPSSSDSNDFDGRNAFEKDYHRIILSASFRRLQDKTQVFPLDQSDFVRTRLTHSLEVSSIAKSIGAKTSSMLSQSSYKNVPSLEQSKEIADLLLCAGLLHDMGNPPFGHYGETTIRNYYKSNLSELTYKDLPLTNYLDEQMQQDLYHFEGNAQVIRLVTKLHYLVDEHGMNLSYGLLNTLMKYPVNSTKVDANSEDARYRKLGYFLAESELFQDITEATGTRKPANTQGRILASDLHVTNSAKPRDNTVKQLSFAPDIWEEEVVRHPLTYLLEAADDISYSTADLEDASRKGNISYIELEDYLKSSSRRDKLSPELRTAYDDLVAKLNHCLEDSKKKHAEKASLYAIQNWVIHVQSALIQSVSETYVDNYQAIMRGEYISDLFNNNLAGVVIDVLGDLAYDFVFSTQYIVGLEVAADTIITWLLEKFVPAIINYDTKIEQKPVERRLVALISDNYRESYHHQAEVISDKYRESYHHEAECKIEREKLYLRLCLVNDYVCGMTDSFARDLYHKFNGIS